MNEQDWKKEKEGLMKSIDVFRGLSNQGKIYEMALHVLKASPDLSIKEAIMVAESRLSDIFNKVMEDAE